MWVTTHEGQLVNLALYPNIKILPAGHNNAVVVVQGNKPIFMSTSQACKQVMAELGKKLEAINTSDLSKTKLKPSLDVAAGLKRE